MRAALIRSRSPASATTQSRRGSQCTDLTPSQALAAAAVSPHTPDHEAPGSGSGSVLPPHLQRNAAGLLARLEGLPSLGFSGAGPEGQAWVQDVRLFLMSLRHAPGPTAPPTSALPTLKTPSLCPAPATEDSQLRSGDHTPEKAPAGLARLPSSDDAPAPALSSGCDSMCSRALSPPGREAGGKRLPPPLPCRTGNNTVAEGNKARSECSGGPAHPAAHSTPPRRNSISSSSRSSMTPRSPTDQGEVCARVCAYVCVCWRAGELVAMNFIGCWIGTGLHFRGRCRGARQRLPSQQCTQHSLAPLTLSSDAGRKPKNTFISRNSLAATHSLSHLAHVNAAAGGRAI